MKYFYIILAAAILSSCNDKDYVCEMVTESNHKDALRFCEGFANSYPNYYEEQSREVSLLYDKKDDGDIIEEKKYNACNGVEYTIRVRLECK